MRRAMCSMFPRKCATARIRVTSAPTATMRYSSSVPHALLGGPRFATVAVSFTEAIGGTSAVTWETALL